MAVILDVDQRILLGNGNSLQLISETCIDRLLV